MRWGPYDIDILELLNITSITQAEADYDSCGNTDKIVAAGDASTFPAAWATRKYAPTTDTAGKWCLPAAGILRNIQKNRSAVSRALSKVDGSPIGCCMMWSSSEHYSSEAWGIHLGNGTFGSDAKYTSYNHVVPVLEF